MAFYEEGINFTIFHLQAGTEKQNDPNLVRENIIKYV